MEQAVMPRTRGAQEARVILAIDTATPAVTAGIVKLDGVEVLAERVTVDARAHAEQLTPNVLAALTDAGLTVDDLGAVVVGCGPGPFTGLRVGMATAAAYGHALGIPVHGVCSLDAIGIGTVGDALVVTDARRREVYWARYRDGVRVDGPAVDAPTDVPTDADAVAGSPEHAALFDLPRLAVVYPTAAGLVRAVADWTAEPAPLIPLYLRRPDAKPRSEQPAATR
jgi:tRNA threonylcarbamoyl adenosine modification protein YeaZ